MKALLLATGPGAEKLAAALREAGADEVVRASDGPGAREALKAGGFAAVLIAEGPASLAAELAAASTAGILALVPEGRFAEALPALTRAGVFALSHPAPRAALIEAVRHAAALYFRLNGAASENEKLRGRLNEEKLVGRAKLALVEYLNMSEAQAHRYIEKQAMDRRISKAEVARSILANYGG